MCDLCEGMSVDDLMVQTADRIVENGYTMMGIIEVGELPYDFVYSIGLTEVDHPELLVRGLPMSIMQYVVGRLADRVVKDKTPLVPGERIDGILEGYPVLIHGPGTADEAEANVATQVYGRDAVTVLQVLWPDMDGAFPTDLYDDLRDQHFAHLQPLLAVRE